ncbi:MAG: acyl CoA:acetate/3-ketoacid CoA transferase [Verrucomicrobia bacterium]|nr:acyl CoA:acetate/3-ketoacid CoA transferase [Verrucomicrobiota bacterium]
MVRSKVTPIETVGELIPDNGVVTVSSSSGLGCPDATLRAIGNHFLEKGTPRGLTTIHPIAAGDMYGIEGIDHIAHPGLLKRVIAGSFPSGPSNLPSPRIWQMIDEDQVEAYNIPSGILYHMHRESAAGRPGVLTKVGIDTFVDPRRNGGRMNNSAPDSVVRVVQFEGEEWLYFPSIPPDVAIIRATTADERGNLTMEHEGAYLGALDQALAARNNGGVVIAQVKRLTAYGTLRPHQVRVPGLLVDYIVVDPEQQQTTHTFYNPAISGEVFRPLWDFKPIEWGPDKIIARRAALELKEEDVVNLGFGICALVPRILLEENLHGEVTWVIEQGAVGGMPLLGFAFGCSSNADAIVASPDQFTYFQGGGFDSSCLSFLQVDRHGNVNVSRLAARPHVTAGCGGFIDITASAPLLLFCGYFTAGGLDLRVENNKLRIAKEGKNKKFVPDVEHVTFSGRRALEQKQKALYITERCVLRLEAEGLTVIEIAPGVDLERDVLAQAAFPLSIDKDLGQMDHRIFQPEPFGLKMKPRKSPPNLRK